MNFIISIKNKASVLYVLYAISAINIILNLFLREISFLDELVMLILMVYGCCYCSFHKQKEFKCFVLVFAFYVVYSLFLSKNVFQAVFLDLLLFMKPFISFYTVYYSTLVLDKELKIKLCKIFWGLGIYCWFVLPFIEIFYANTAAFYPCCLLASLSYLFFSERKRTDIYWSLFFLIPGLPTMRSKFFTIFICFIYIFLFEKRKFHLNLRSISILSLIVILSIIISYRKFSIYFIDGLEMGAARTFLFYTSLQIFVDYFPFGSGLGTFGSEAAARYYSPLYFDYNLDVIYGLSPEDYGTSSNFLNDTFYPVLAEFGVVGVCFYVLFWWKRFKDVQTLRLTRYKFFLIIFLIVSIQNIADTAFISPYSVPLMMLLGFSIKEVQIKKTINNSNIQEL